VCAACIRANEEFLASDALQGRGSGTRDEEIAATYVAAQLRQYGIAPAGDDGGYIQRAPTVKAKLTSAPQLKIASTGGAAPMAWSYGKEFIVRYLAQTKFSGPLQKLDADQSDPETKVQRGAVVLVMGADRKKVSSLVSRIYAGGAVALLVPGREGEGERFARAAKELPEMGLRLAGKNAPSLLGGGASVLEPSKDAAAELAKQADGVEVTLEATASEEQGSTWNAIGILRGSDPKLRDSAILLSAHLDHLGIGVPVNGDAIYNGADDDASGTTAVLEMARVLGRGPRPRRTVIFALFGSEEVGGLGSIYFEDHPPVPLLQIAANLEFEMIGRADPKVKANTVWLTGWERTNLGPALAAHGAKLVADPHPEQNFFRRSDNYVLAKKGVVAQTVSSYGLHKDYHAPSDDVAHLDFAHMEAAIGSMIEPVQWLANSNFVPAWKEGGKP
jgi:aminopeptidase YwaD